MSGILDRTSLPFRIYTTLIRISADYPELSVGEHLHNVFVTDISDEALYDCICNYQEALHQSKLKCEPFDINWIYEEIKDSNSTYYVNKQYNKF